jgi:hypothetical protein
VKVCEKNGAADVVVTDDDDVDPDPLVRVVEDTEDDVNDMTVGL